MAPTFVSENGRMFLNLVEETVYAFSLLEIFVDPAGNCIPSKD